MNELKANFVVVGGGIAGVSCVETLLFLCPAEKIILLTESSIIKRVVNLVPLAKSLTKFDIEEQDVGILKGNLEVIVDRLITVNSVEKCIETEKGKKISYQYLCLCTGARPKLIEQAANNPNVLGIRDTESVLEFQERIKGSRKIILVGNGGIASEVVYELKNISIDWVIKDNFISQTFVDPGAAEFFQNRLKNKDKLNVPADGGQSTIKRMRYEENLVKSKAARKTGAALGPDWHRKLDLSGTEKELPSSVNVHTCCQVELIEMNENSSAEFPLRVKLTNGEVVYGDLLVSATGVNPQINFKINQEFKIASDGGILVNELMKTSIESIYAAGDVCTADWTLSEHWFQMRLWTQARQMGAMAGKSIAAAFDGEEIYQDFCFELFGHVTQLFGYQVVLLGKYNGQGLGTNYEALIRFTPETEYIKYVIVDGKLHGAILIGETGLEETTENLILNQLDVRPYGDDLLNPNIDIEDYFD